jgi:HSP20 family protein
MSLIKREHRSTWPDMAWSQDMVDTTFGDMLRSFFGSEGLFHRTAAGDPHPMRLEEYVEEGTFVIRAELPGIDPEKDVDISVGNGLLMLRAEREERTEQKRPDGYRSEFRYGRLARNIRLPEGVDESQVTARYQDGILEVRVPLPEPAATEAPKKIEVARG